MGIIEIGGRVTVSYLIPKPSNPKRDSRLFIDGVNLQGDPSSIELNYREVCGLIDALQVFIKEVKEYGKKN